MGKQIRWEQSKRLRSGSLVALTPANDKFQEKIVIATVAARPLDMLQRNPPEIDLFIARAEEQEFDPMVEWLMVENRQSFYEAGRHTLAALQKMMREPSVTLLAMTHRFYALAQADLHLIASFVTETDTC